MYAISRRSLGALVCLGAIAAVAGCSPSDPLAPTPTPEATVTATGGNLVVGSQQYYSNEIIAELYAQALEGVGFTVDRQFQIGQREVYLPELEAGKIDILPEYSGNLLQFYDSATSARSPEEVAAGLAEALPEGLRVLAPAEASDQDSYNVTGEFASANGLASLADLAKLPQPVKIAANSELSTRPYGPKGLKELYGVDATVVPVEDSGGPLTLKALKDGSADVANIYTANPAIAAEGLVTLTDPENLILPQNVIPLVSAAVDDAAAAAIDAVNAKLSATELQKLNARSVDEQKKSSEIASDWLKEQGLA